MTTEIKLHEGHINLTKGCIIPAERHWADNALRNCLAVTYEEDNDFNNFASVFYLNPNWAQSAMPELVPGTTGLPE